MKPIAVIYGRCSDKSQKDKGYLNNIITSLKEDALNEGFEPMQIQVFKDIGVSKYLAFEERNGMSKLLRYLGNRHPLQEITIFVEKLTRIAGKPILLREFLQMVRREGYKVFVWELGGYIDLNNWDAVEELIKEQTDNVQKIDAKRKKATSNADFDVPLTKAEQHRRAVNQGKARPGYPLTWDEDKNMFTVDTKATRVICYCYAYRHMDGRQIAQELKDRMIPTPSKGVNWSDKAVERVLNKDNYVTGIKVIDGEEFPCEEVIDQYTHTRIQEMKDFRKQHGSKFRKGTSPFRGYVRCLQCNKVMDNDKGKFICKDCNIKADEELVSEKIIETARKYNRDLKLEGNDAVKINLRVYGRISVDDELDWVVVSKNWFYSIKTDGIGVEVEERNVEELLSE